MLEILCALLFHISHLAEQRFFIAMPPKERMSADYYRQMAYLQRNGVRLDNLKECQQALRDITYYRLKGYFLLFRGQRVKFKTLLDIYEFDSQMRSILLHALSTIEIHLRARFSYFHSHKYGAYGYLRAANYSVAHNHAAFCDSLQKSVDENSRLLFVEHYAKQYGGLMPFWVMSELMGLGEWFYFYNGMTKHDKSEFLKRLLKGRNPPASVALQQLFSNERRFSQWLGCCRNLRNACAHCGRLYGVNFPQNPPIPYVCGTSKTRKRAAALNKLYLHQRLFGSIIAVMFLYPDAGEWNGEILPNIKSLLTKYGAKGLDMNCIGFPPDWETWLEKP